MLFRGMLFRGCYDIKTRYMSRSNFLLGSLLVSHIYSKLQIPNSFVMCRPVSAGTVTRLILLYVNFVSYHDQSSIWVLPVWSPWDSMGPQKWNPLQAMWSPKLEAHNPYYFQDVLSE